MRRRKKLIFNILKIVIRVAVVAILFFMFKPKKTIDTTNTNNKTGELLNVTTVTEPNRHVDLPKEIKDTASSSNQTQSSNKSNDSKTYEPILETSDRYLITKLSKLTNEVTILIGDDSSKLLDSNSKTQVGIEYNVNNIPETIVSEYYFSIDAYSYPIVLLLGESGKLYYINIEKAYKSGNFTVDGYIKNIPEVENVYETTVNQNGKTYRSAVITCANGEGYEFNIGMIGM